jgi:lysophospholipase L1-like esterase
MEARTAPNSEVRYLALGDSYTIGEGVSPADRWPTRLAATMRAMGIPVGEPIVIARTGWTTDELSAAIDETNPPETFDVVTLLIGVNNQYRGRSVEEYRVQFRALLGRAVAFASARADRVVVVSIPDWGVTPYATQPGRNSATIASEIEAFNAAARDEAAAAGAHFVDVTETSRRALSESDLTADDGLHPSARMYGLWTRLILPAALEAVQSARR